MLIYKLVETVSGNECQGCLAEETNEIRTNVDMGSLANRMLACWVCLVGLLGVVGRHYIVDCWKIALGTALS